MNEWEWQLLDDKAVLDHCMAGGIELRIGDRIRLRPRQGGDIIDVALAGKIAIIEGIEQDYEGKVHVAVVIDEDPGKDLGLPRQPGLVFSLALRKSKRLLPGVPHNDESADSHRVRRKHLPGRRRFRRRGCPPDGRPLAAAGSHPERFRDSRL